MKKILWSRKCDCCGKGMDRGYCINSGEYYFCTEECLDNAAWESDVIPSVSELANMPEDEVDWSDSYWTEWDADDKQYQEINGVLTLIEE